MDDSDSDHPVPSDDGVPLMAAVYELGAGAGLERLTAVFNEVKAHDDRHQRLIRLSAEERYRTVLSRIELSKRIKANLNFQFSSHRDDSSTVMEEYYKVMDSMCGVKSTQAALYLRLSPMLADIHRMTKELQAEQEADGKEPTFPSLDTMGKWCPAKPRAKDEREFVQRATRQAKVSYQNMQEEERRAEVMKANDAALEQKQRADRAEQDLWAAHDKLTQLQSELDTTRAELAKAQRELAGRREQPDAGEMRPLLLTGPRPRQVKPEIETPDVIELGTDESIAPEHETIEPGDMESIFAMALEATGLAAELTDNKALRAAESHLELPRVWTGKAPQSAAHRARKAQLAFARLLERPDCPLDDGTVYRVRTIMAAITNPYEFWTRAAGLSFDALIEEWRDKGQL